MRADLAEARTIWLKESVHDPDEYARREQSDFLLDTNYEGESNDFHCFRNTCGAWLAKTGVHPHVVQSVMWHQSDLPPVSRTSGHAAVSRYIADLSVRP